MITKVALFYGIHILPLTALNYFRLYLSTEYNAVIHLRKGLYGLVEIKPGGAEGVKTLNKLAANIDTSKMKQPAFKIILTGTGTCAYKRKDGIRLLTGLGRKRREKCS